jgi:farnesyl diphosphate synthase
MQNLQYNTLGGKYNRGMAVVDTVALLRSGSGDHHDGALAADELWLAAVLGWCTELLQAFFLVADDIMDASHTRRGQPCWFRRPAVGMVAINDAFMLEAAIYTLLRRHVRARACYADVLELFHEVTFQTELGQQSDLLTATPAVTPTATTATATTATTTPTTTTTSAAPSTSNNSNTNTTTADVGGGSSSSNSSNNNNSAVDLSRFSLDTYRFIVAFKTAYYSFYLPVALALHLCGAATPRNLAQARRVLLPLGEYFQVQDDFLDCYGAPAVLGKIGTDIADGKCSWLVNEALRRASAEQRAVLEANYGRGGGGGGADVDDAKAAEARVKQVYNELRLEDVYRAYEEERVRELRALIAEVDESEGLKRAVFENFLAKIYKRDR